jgi:hypothetical protein
MESFNQYCIYIYIYMYVCVCVCVCVCVLTAFHSQTKFNEVHMLVVKITENELYIGKLIIKIKQ